MPPKGFQEWWDQYKQKVPTKKRNSIQYWTLIGWNAHAEHLDQVDQNTKSLIEKLIEEYGKTGRWSSVKDVSEGKAQ